MTNDRPVNEIRVRSRSDIPDRFVTSDGNIVSRDELRTNVKIRRVGEHATRWLCFQRSDGVWLVVEPNGVVTGWTYFDHARGWFVVIRPKYLKNIEKTAVLVNRMIGTGDRT
jgi:hypothetical protein